MTKDWFYTQAEEQCGPVGEAELRRMVAQGQLADSDLVWSEGMPGWLESHQVFGGGPGQRTAQPYAAPTASGASSAPARRDRRTGNSAQIHNPYAAPNAHPSPEVPLDEVWEFRGFKWLVTSYEGRIPRSKYWLGVLALTGLLLFVVVGWVALAVGLASALGLNDESSGLLVGSGVIALLVFWHYFLFAVMSKRWHDRGKSGWMCLVRFIPQIGGIWILIECGCLPGDMGANQYEPDPLLGLHR